MRLAEMLVLLLFSSPVSLVSSATLLFEQNGFPADATGAAAVAALYPRFTLSGAGASLTNVSTLLGVAEVDGAGVPGGNGGFFSISTAGFPSSLVIVSRIGRNSTNSGYNIGLRVGQNNIVYHPGAPTGFFRVEGDGGFTNRDMGFTPAAFAFQNFTVCVNGTTGEFLVGVHDVGAPAPSYAVEFKNPNYAPGTDRIGFRVQSRSPGLSGMLAYLAVHSDVPCPVQAPIPPPIPPPQEKAAKDSIDGGAGQTGGIIGGAAAAVILLAICVVVVVLVARRRRGEDSEDSEEEGVPGPPSVLVEVASETEYSDVVGVAVGAAPSAELNEYDSMPSPDFSPEYGAIDAPISPNLIPGSVAGEYGGITPSMSEYGGVTPTSGSEYSGLPDPGSSSAGDKTNSGTEYSGLPVEAEYGGLEPADDGEYDGLPSAKD
jgi:hypothetical protein